MSNGLITGDESLEKTPLADLEFMGVPTRMINTLETSMKTLWVEDLPVGEKLMVKLMTIRMIGPHTACLIAKGVEKLRKGQEG